MLGLKWDHDILKNFKLDLVSQKGLAIAELFIKLGIIVS